MKNNFKLFQIFLLMCGVFGAGTDEEKTVMEGESVTLNPDLTQIPAFIELLWRFRDSHLVIAQIEENNISYPNLPEMFKDRLKLDQTGSLTITNMKTKHSGLYRLEINHNTGTLNLNFRVTVYESPAVIDAFKGETKSVSETEGYPVTLQTDTETHGDELIVWRFGDEGKLIAKHDLEAKSSPLYDPDERFRDRLKLDNLTGSLTITNTRITDSGVYTVKISSSKQTLYKRFTVTVSPVPVPPLSSGAVAGIVGGVLLVLSAAAGVFYYRHKLSELLKQKNISVKERESLTLTSGIEINKDDEIQWLFGDEKKTVIAEIKRGTGEITVPPDGRFRDRLKIDEKTGSLIITNTRPEDAGVYELRITGDRLVQNLCRRLVQNLNKTFIVHVRDEVNSVSVMKGADVTLRANTEIQTGDKIFWMFGHDNSLVAKNTEEKCEEESEFRDSRFTDNVDLNHQTGDLTIKKIRTDHTGEYKLKIIRNGKSSFKLFDVSVYGQQVNKSVLKGRPVTLKCKSELQRDFKIQWKFGEKLIAEMTGENRENPQWTDDKFRDQMELDPQTGSLIIQQTTHEHSGLYTREIKTSYYSTFRLFNLTVFAQVNESVLKGDSVTLCDTDTEIQKDDKIQWKFGEKLIVEMTGEDRENPQWTDEFRGQMKLNPQTGSLTIQQTRSEHSGLYKLEIKSRDYSAIIPFILTVCDKAVSVMEGKDVTLRVNPEIQTGDKSGDDNRPVAKNTEDACSSYYEEKRKLLKDSTEKRKNDSVAVEMQRF